MSKARCDEPEKYRSPKFVVGIGASAGGLDALRALISNLPGEGDLALIIAQHLSPHHRSLLTELLGRETDLPVVEATGGEQLLANTIYVCPPNTDLTIEDARLVVTTPQRSTGPKPSIDILFNSLAQAFGERAVGVILSGTGSDGAHGARAIRAIGGLMIAQDPETAQYDSMPRSSIEQGAAELIMPPSAIGKQLAYLVTQPRDEDPNTTRSLDTEVGPLGEIINSIWRRQKLDFSKYKDSTIGRQLDRRMAALQLKSLDDYLSHINQFPDELDVLAKSFLISVTVFFRDGESFDALRSAMVSAIAKKATGEGIRVWVPGCATGEEAYSISIMLHEVLGNDVKNHPVQIFATDIDTDATSRARRGLYPEAALQDVDEDLIKRYFTLTANGYQVDKRILETVVFARQDLIRDPPFLRLDLISCRNVLIYFKPDLQEHLFRVFHYALNPGGILFLGQSEVVTGAASLFQKSSKQQRIFVRNDLAPALPLGMNMYRPNIEFTGPAKAKVLPKPPDPKTILRDELVKRYAPPTALLNSENCLVELQGSTKQFFEFGEGAAKLDALTLIRSDLRTELRALLHRTRYTDKEEVLGRAFSTNDGRFQMRVCRVEGVEDVQDAVLLSFLPIPVESEAANGEQGDGSALSETAEAHIRQLEQELTATREHLHVVIEELETSNEELQSLNEELQASGEELQASNEELATSNEELQATNEELTTVNDELQAKTLALSDAVTDLENVQDATTVAMVVVDHDLLVTRFNAQAIRMIGLTDTDIGRNFGALPIRLQIPDLYRRLTDTLKGTATEPIEVAKGGEVFLVEFRSCKDNRGKIIGVVLTLADITEAKHAEAALRNISHMFTMVTENQDVVVWVQEPNTGRVIFVSPGYRTIFGLDPEMLLRDSEHMFKVMHREDAVRYRQLSKSQSGLPWSVRTRINHPRDGSLRWLQTRAYPVIEGGSVQYYTGIVTDVTDDVVEIGSDENFSRVYDMMLDSACDGVLGFNSDGRVAYANRKGADLFGIDESELRGASLDDLFEDDYASLLREALIADQTVRMPVVSARIKKGDGSVTTTDLMISTDPVLRCSKACAVVVIRDDSTNSSEMRRLRVAANAFSNSPDGVLVLGADTRVMAVNPAALRILKLDEADLLGHVPTVLRSDNPSSAFSEEIWSHLKAEGRWQGEVHLQLDDGEFVVLDMEVSPLDQLHGDDPGRYLVTMTDTTQARTAQELVYQHAHLDSLTGLPNRRLMLDSLNQEIRHAERDGYGVTLMFIDLDRFKEVNDSLGHEAGDQLLVEASRRIRDTVRASDTVARFGGDEFVLLLPKYQRSQAPELTARNIVRALEEPFDVKGQTIYLSASIGIAIYPQDGIDSSELLRNADAAMYKAKQEGRRGFAFYQPELNRDAVRRMTLEAELHQAVEGNELHVYYQPIIDVATGWLTSLEALIRWQHPKRGLLSPAQFVPYAEHIGLIDDITQFVMNDARRNLANWRERFDPNLRATINLCSRQFRTDSFRRLFRDESEDLSAFVFEVTESTLENDVERHISDSLHWLRDAGARVALDDFGTGYSSLSRVRRFPVDIIKIDREFVVESANNQRDAALIDAVVTMAHGIDATVIAEGVDSERQARMMKDLGVDAIQGFLYSEPVPAGDAECYMEERRSILVEPPEHVRRSH